MFKRQGSFGQSIHWSPKRPTRPTGLRSVLCWAVRGAVLAGLTLGARQTAWAAEHDVADFSSFQNAINVATDGDVININGDITMTGSVGLINDNITVNGNNHIINGDKNFRPFFVESGNVVINNLTIEDGKAKGGNGGGGGGGGLGAGGAIFVNSGANVSLSNVAFTGNEAIGGNGASSGGGGGGGLGGNGGESDGEGGGGGGGLGGDGGDNEFHTAGGGGGGIDGNGGHGRDHGGGGGGGIGSDGEDSQLIEGGSGGGGGGDGGGDFGDRDGGDGSYGGGGGGGGAHDSLGGNGGFGGGGGGGSGLDGDGGAGGDFGGGGGGGWLGHGGDGGFGGGGGGSLDSTGGKGGFGGGHGGSGAEGSGGSGFGGAVFVRDGGTLTINGASFEGGGASGGMGGGGGSSDGTALFLHGVDVTFDVAKGESISIADTIAGMAVAGSGGGLVKAGEGTLRLTGANSYQGETIVDAGRLEIDGAIASSTTIASGGELGGTGTITGDVVNNGTLAAGNSIGNMTIHGDFTSNSGSNTEVEIRPATNPTIAGTDNDHITIQGSATLNGGTVSVQGAEGEYIDGTQYTFVTADSVSGTFDSITDDLAFFDAVLGYTGESVFFSLIANSTDFRSVAQTHNQAAVGAYVDQHSQGAQGDFSTVLDAFQPLTDTQVQSSLSQLSGEIFGTTSQICLHNSSQMIRSIGQLLRSRLSPSRAHSPGSLANSSVDGPVVRGSDSLGRLVSYSEPVARYRSPAACSCRKRYGWHSWALGYGLGGAASSDGNAGAVDYGLGGTTVGIERFLDCSTRIGFFGGYAGSRVTTSGMNQSNRINGGNFGGFLTRTSDRRYGMLLGGLQLDGYESDRTLQVGTLSRVAHGETSGLQGFAYGEQGLNLQLSHSIMLQPFAGMQYVYIRQNGFTETGAGAINLDVAGIDTHSLRSMLGGRWQLASRVTRRGSKVTPELRGIWMHEFLDTSSVFNAQFAGLGGASFVTNGLHLGRDWAMVGGGLANRVNDCWQIRVDYNAQINDHQVFHVGSGVLSYSW